MKRSRMLVTGCPTAQKINQDATTIPRQSACSRRKPSKVAEISFLVIATKTFARLWWFRPAQPLQEPVPGQWEAAPAYAAQNIHTADSELRRRAAPASTDVLHLPACYWSAS